MPLSLEQSVINKNDRVPLGPTSGTDANKNTSLIQDDIDPIHTQTQTQGISTIAMNKRSLGFTPHNLLQVPDSISFSLYDELVLDDSHLGGFMEGENTIRTEKHYLGQICKI